jgi:hypothetical protein
MSKLSDGCSIFGIFVVSARLDITASFLILCSYIGPVKYYRVIRVEMCNFKLSVF